MIFRRMMITALATSALFVAIPMGLAHDDVASITEEDIEYSPEEQVYILASPFV